MGANSGRGAFPISTVWVNRRGLPSPLYGPIRNQTTVSGISLVMTDWYFGQATPPPPAGSSYGVPLRTMMGMGF